MDIVERLDPFTTTPMEITEVFRINKDGSVTVFEASPEQYQKAIKMLIDWKDDEIERLREALQKIADWPDYRSPSHQEIARAALKEKE